MISWHEPHAVYGRGDLCQACGCGWTTDEHMACDPSVTGGPLAPQSRLWFCTICIYKERLRPAVVSFIRPAPEGYVGAATWYCEEHLEGDHKPMAFSPEIFLLNAARHAATEELRDMPGDHMLPDLLLGAYYDVA